MCDAQWVDLAQHLMAMNRPLHAKERLGIALDAVVYAFDASTIDLCLSLHPLAPECHGWKIG